MMQTVQSTKIGATSPKDERFTHFIFDFDCTITKTDTCNLIAQVGIEHAKTYLGQDLTPSWKSISNAYWDEYLLAVTDNEAEGKSLEERIVHQRNKKELELRSIRRISESGLFKGICKEEWEDSGREAIISGKLKIRNGFKELVEEIERREGVWGIVSVSWSKDFIRGVLAQYLGKPLDISIMANSAERNGEIIGPLLQNNLITMPLVSSDTKLAAMEQLLKDWKLDDTAQAVYYGDSSTDIECLFHPSVEGILVGDDENSDILKIFGFVNNTLLIESYTPDFENIITLSRPPAFVSSLAGSALLSISP